MKKYLPSFPNVPDELVPFIEAINQSYDHHEEDRMLLERAMLLSSKELTESKSQLKTIMQKQAQVLESLKEAANKLLPNQYFTNDTDLLKISDMLYTEIEKRRKAEHKSLVTENTMLSIFNNLKLGMAQIDITGKFLDVNCRFSEMLGYKSEEMIGKSAMALLGAPATFKEIRKQLKNNESPHEAVFEAPLLNKKGELIWILCSTTPTLDENDNKIGTSAVFFDISSQKQLQSELRESQEEAHASLEARKAILANVSHELRTPINAIVGMSSLLEQTELSNTQREYIEALKSSSEGLMVLIDDLLNVSKIESGKLRLESIPFSLDKMLRVLTKSLGLKAEEKGLSIQYYIDPKISKYHLGDPTRINQIISNLVSNSIKFTKHGSVKISAALIDVEDDKQCIRFAVKDTGIGIESSQQGIIFQKFQQEDTSTTRKYGGTGLGLNISKQLVEIMGGDLKLVSEKEIGTEFSFKLILPSALAPDMEEPVEKNLCNARVLLVEDNEINRFLAVTIIKQWNAQVEVATDGYEALEKLKEAEFDIILMDLQMPRMGGYEASEKIRGELKINIPIIALTANALTNEYDKCLDSGMNDYVSKPFQPDFLYQKMSDCMAIHNTAHQLNSLKRA